MAAVISFSFRCFNNDIRGCFVASLHIRETQSDRKMLDNILRSLLSNSSLVEKSLLLVHLLLSTGVPALAR
jgi:hypothetical protein